MKRLLYILTAFLVLGISIAGQAVNERPSAIFVVNEASDTLDSSPGDGICADSAGNCTLRAAVMEANATDAIDTINFAADLASTITLTRGQIPIENRLVISGPGARLLTIQRTTAANSSLFRLFDIKADSEIRGLTLRNGYGSNGGAIRSSAMITLSELAIIGNSANAGGAIYAEAAPAFTIIERCLISGNSALTQGGAIFTAPSTSLIVRSSTVTGNVAVQAGAIANNGWLILANNTIVRNSARYWSEIVNPGGAKIELVNNIIGANNGRSTGVLSGRFFSLGGNLITNSVGSSFSPIGFTPPDIIGLAGEIDPLLGELSNNGGPTDSITPLPGSRAINGGSGCVIFLTSCLGTSDYWVQYDQRRYARAVGAVDIGAIEVNAGPVATSSKN